MPVVLSVVVFYSVIVVGTEREDAGGGKNEAR